MNEPRTPGPPPRVERRPKPRKRVLLGGRIVYSNGDHYFDCAIRDLSETGARIAISRGQPIPANVFLIEMRDRKVHEAKVVWNNGREVGLNFVRSFALAGITDPNLAYLKRLCR
jgi:hypothetical protein